MSIFAKHSNMFIASVELTERDLKGYIIRAIEQKALKVVSVDFYYDDKNCLRDRFATPTFNVKVAVEGKECETVSIETIQQEIVDVVRLDGHHPQNLVVNHINGGIGRTETVTGKLTLILPRQI